MNLSKEDMNLSKPGIVIWSQGKQQYRDMIYHNMPLDVTRCCLLMTYEDMGLGQHWLRYWIVG